MLIVSSPVPQRLHSILRGILRPIQLFTRIILPLALVWGMQMTPADAALPGFHQLFAGSPPPLGIENDRLAPCPPSPNCVVSEGADPSHSIPPLTYEGDRSTAYQHLLAVLNNLPRTRIIEANDGYIRAEFESRLFGFVDDGEFYFPAQEGLIQVRSASRLGESDLGVNRDRIEQIRAKLQSP